MRLPQAIACLAMAMAPGVSAAQATTGDLRGRVLGPGTDPLAGSAVTLRGAAIIGARATIAAGDGFYQFLGLPPGTYSVQVQRIGYHPIGVDSLRVRLGATTQAPDAVLQPLTVALSATRIVASKVSLDPARTTVGAVLEQADFRALPGERDYKALMASLPHVNASYYGDLPNVAGNSGLENMYFIDGVNATMPLTAGSGTGLPYNFVQSVEVRAGGYEAEYGRALGAIVNAVTWTGGDRFEANAFGFFTHGAMSARPRAAPSLAERGMLTYDVGVRVSGPIVRERAWFSAAWNPKFERVTRTIGALGAFPAQFRGDAFAAKATWIPASQSLAEVSIFGDPSDRRDVGTNGLDAFTPAGSDPFRGRFRSGGWTAVGRWQREFGRAGSVEAQIARSTGVGGEEGVTAGGKANPIVYDEFAGTVGGGYGFFADVSFDRTSGAIKVLREAGRHTIKAGAEFETGVVRSHAGTTSPGMITRSGDDSTSWSVYEADIPARVRSIAPAGFIQDSWRASDALTLNAGIRWATQRIVGTSGRTAQSLAQQWQPRVGMSWQLGSRRLDRVFASVGRFYQQQPLYLASIWFAEHREVFTLFTGNPQLPGAQRGESFDWSTPESTWKTLEGVKPDHADELTLGYERVVAGIARATVRGIWRAERSAVVWVPSAGGRAPTIAVPGEGDLAGLPFPRRTYGAVELDLEGTLRDAVRYRASYIFSRNSGNYSGLFNQDGGCQCPGVNSSVGRTENPSGLLPNDRTHVTKLSVTWQGSSPLRAGVLLTWQSGTPISEMVAVANTGGGTTFAGARGAAGRTPAIADASLRLSYALGAARGVPSTLILDVLHVGNARTAVRLDQLRYDRQDDAGNPTGERTTFRQPLAFQPPMMARLGVEIGR